MYKVGYFYHLNGAKDVALVLCLIGDYFRYYVVEKKIIPRKYWNVDCYQRNVLKHVVLCKIIDDYVSEIVFVDDIPIGFRHKGFCISMDADGVLPILLKEGNNFVEHYIEGDKSIEFIDLMINYVFLQREILNLKQSLDFFHFPSSESTRSNVISKFKKRLDSFDIKNILSSLTVELCEYYSSKIGSDSSYCVCRIASLQDKSVIVDDYIRSIVKLGRQEIYEETAFAPVLELKENAQSFLTANPLGLYSGERLAKEKRKIIAKYSREEHMAYLFFEQLVKNERETEALLKKEKKISEILEKRNKYFYYDKLSNVNSIYFAGFEKKDSSCIDLLQILNKHVFRVQQNFPVIRVLFSGEYYSDKRDVVLENYQYTGRGVAEYNRYMEEIKKDMEILREVYYNKIGEIIEELSKQYIVKIVTGKASGIEWLAYQYAVEKKIECITNDYKWYQCDFYQNKHRAYQMVETCDHVFLLGSKNSPISKNILVAVEEKNIPLTKIFTDN